MDIPLYERSANANIPTTSVRPGVVDQLSTMSPISNLAVNLSSLTTTMAMTPTRRISFSNSEEKKFTIPSAFTGSPISVDSPMLQEGILRGGHAKKGKNFKSRQSFVRSISSYFSPISQNKENIKQYDNSSSVKSVLHFPSRDCTESDSLDELSGASQESGFVDQCSRNSQSSVPSIRSSVFTDEELDDDDEDCMFPVDKFIEDEPSSEVPSSISELLTCPIKESAGTLFKFDFSSWGRNQPKKSMRRCLSMVNAEINYKPSSSHEKMVDNIIWNTKEDNESTEKTVTKLQFKRPEPLNRGMTPYQSKRRKSSPSVTVPSHSLRERKNQSALVRCYSETSATIMKALQRSDQQPDLIGDCSKTYALPLVKGRHPDLKTITAETLVKLIKGEFQNFVKDFLVVDCRYPYEFKGGHIIGAKNIYTKDDIYRTLLSNTTISEDTDQRNVIIFHCEFSSERAPKLLRFLRNKDRELNEDFYPRLHHPEIYILDGGYKAFYQDFKEFCDPQEYKPMLHKNHSEELKEFQKEGKSKKVRDNQSYGVKGRRFRATCDDV